MIKFKSCPKCVQGDLVLGRDVYGWYMKCFQCAQIVDMVAAPAKVGPSKQAKTIAQAAA